MFLLVPSERSGFWKAKISEDNLTIEWPTGPDNSWTEPPWEDLFMEQYASHFYQALSDYRTAEVMRGKLAGPNV